MDIDSLRRIAQIYAIEKKIRGKSPKVQLEVHRARTAPVVEDFGIWLRGERGHVSPKSRPGGARSWPTSETTGTVLRRGARRLREGGLVGAPEPISAWTSPIAPSRSSKARDIWRSSTSSCQCLVKNTRKLAIFTLALTPASRTSDYAIRPLIDTRLLWREEKQVPDYVPSEPILRLLNPDRTGNVLHTERGEVHCRCPRSGEIRPMAYQGLEADRNTLKYRRPAAAYDLDCQGQGACLARRGSKAGSYGRIVRIKLDKSNRRIFTLTPWGSPSWKRGYNLRSALERINARLDRVYGFEVHFVPGIAKMRSWVSLSFAVMMALALASAEAGRGERMRSLVEPVPVADTDRFPLTSHRPTGASHRLHAHGGPDSGSETPTIGQNRARHAPVML